MSSAVIEETLNIVQQYIAYSYDAHYFDLLYNNLSKIIGKEIHMKRMENYAAKSTKLEYEGLQTALATINEKGDMRKHKGIYYTPTDVMRFIIANCFRASYGLINCDNLTSTDYSVIPVREFCLEKNVLEPTCGAGEFLLAALSAKLDLWESAVWIVNSYLDKKDKVLVLNSMGEI